MGLKQFLPFIGHIYYDLHYKQVLDKILFKKYCTMKQLLYFTEC